MRIGVLSDSSYCKLKLKRITYDYNILQLQHLAVTVSYSYSILPSITSTQLLDIIMPATTRSQTRTQLNHLKNAPYPIDFLTRIKSKYPKNHENIQDLLNREITPPPETVIDGIIEVAQNCMDENDKLQNCMNENDKLKQQIAEFRAFHTLGDILYKCLTSVRKHIYNNNKKNISTFMEGWEINGIDDDTTEEAEILKDFIKQGAKTKAKDASYIKKRFERYKTWLKMYADRCNLVHSGFDDMAPQAIWDALKDIERDLNSGTITFENPDWKQHALEAIADMKTFKFNCKNNKWEDKEGNPIEV
jgi:hypothetical protein